MQILQHLLDVSSTDPEDARRRKLLNILLAGTAALILLTFVATTAVFVSGVYQDQVIPLYLGGLIALCGIGIIFALNRYRSGPFAGALFLVILTIAFVFADQPEEVARGRSLFMFAIPILMASVLLRPYASFIMAGLIGLIIGGVELFVLDSLPNVPATVAFFAIALVSWLSARSVERALADVRRTNRELDQRVEGRTRDLAEALAREHAELSKNQAILVGIADGVIVFDNNGKAIVANPAIGRLLDRTSESIIGHSIQSLMGKDVDEDDRQVVSKLLEAQALQRTSIKIEWATKTLSMTVAPVRDVSSRVIGTVAVFRDFTREAEVDRMKSDFVSIVSHELRTPLTSIKGYLDLVLMGAAGAVNKQQESFLRIAKDNTERLNELVTDLLDISRIESGKIELNVEVVSLRQVLEQVANSLAQQFEDRGLSLVIDLPPSLPEVFGDAHRIAQIVSNLLTNASKYTARGGATVRAQVIGHTVQVDVIDTGIGISPDDQEKLFTRFFRAEDAMVRQQPGTGLGLHITKSLVEMHGGQIWVRSRPGGGTTFSFTLPLPAGLVYEPTAAGPGQTQPSHSLPAPSPTGPCILVADDQPAVANLFRYQLEREGYRVHVVTQGSRVLEVARQLRPALITLDLLMDVDGLTVLQDLKADPTTEDIPVIVISVVPGPQKGLTLGAADYLVKPLDEAELLDRVRQVLAQLDGRPKNRILVVDDEKDVAGWLNHILTHYGFQVSEAHDGIEALEAVKVEKPDLILMDLRMPRLDGRGAIHRLREQEETRSIPIIVLTASPLSDDLERVQMISMGVTQFLHKPVRVEQLVGEIRRYLEQQTR